MKLFIYLYIYLLNSEIILTFGYSTSVLRYLRAAAIHRNFEVYVVESSPSYCGRKMAKDLLKSMDNENPNAKSKKKISITLIHDNEVYTIMARVNKVIVGANYVTADGGFFGLAGMNLVTLSAKAYAVPVICIVPIYKVYIYIIIIRCAQYIVMMLIHLLRHYLLYKLCHNLKWIVHLIK